MNDNKLINEKLICAFRWSVLSSERDLQVLGVRRWRELVIDREKWKDIVRQTKAHWKEEEEEE